MAENPRIEELRRRVHADPASIAFAALAEEFRRVGRYEDAVETCRTGLLRHPAYLSARVTLGRSLIETGDFDGAREELETVLRSAPENLAAIRGLAQIHERLGHSAEMDPHLAEMMHTMHEESLRVVSLAPPAPPPPPPAPEPSRAAAPSLELEPSFTAPAPSVAAKPFAPEPSLALPPSLDSAPSLAPSPSLDPAPSFAPALDPAPSFAASLDPAPSFAASLDPAPSPSLDPAPSFAPSPAISMAPKPPPVFGSLNDAGAFPLDDSLEAAASDPFAAFAPKASAAPKHDAFDLATAFTVQPKAAAPEAMMTPAAEPVFDLPLEPGPAPAFDAFAPPRRGRPRQFRPELQPGPRTRSRSGVRTRVRGRV